MDIFKENAESWDFIRALVSYYYYLVAMFVVLTRLTSVIYFEKPEN